MSDLIPTGFFEAEAVVGDTDEIIISGDWTTLSDEEFEQAATERHRDLDQQESVINALKNRIILEKGELYTAAKAKLRHGKFATWLEKIQVSPTTAQDYMKLARELGDELANARRVGHLPVRQWIKIARSPASKQIVAKLEAGEVQPTSKAINAEIEAANKRAEGAEANAKKIEQESLLALVKADDRVNEAQLQARLLEDQVESKQSEINRLTRQIAEMEREYHEPQTIYQDVIPDDVAARLVELESKLGDAVLTEQRLIAERDEKAAQLKQKTERLKKMYEEMGRNTALTEQLRHTEEIRYKWRQCYEAIHHGINQAFARMVTPLDAKVAFEPDDWARLAEIESTLKQALERLARLRESVNSQFIDTSIEDYVEA